MQSKQIAVLGFGRSGTTWISDIISKVTGTIILFEPLHPRCTDLAERYSYSNGDGENDSHELQDYLRSVLGKQRRESWLLRNHVPFGLESITDSFLHSVWAECQVSGFKEIRANMMIPWLCRALDTRIVFMARHPCAVIASIKSRPNFWKEFGWTKHYDMFIEKTIEHPAYAGHEIIRHIDAVRSASSDIEKQAVMWAVTHAIALPQLKHLGIPLFYYEDFYSRPFEAVRSLLGFLGCAQLGIHPAHVFTPSMTTLKTTHGLYTEEIAAKKGAVFFWENVLSREESIGILRIVNSFGVTIYDEGGFPVR